MFFSLSEGFQRFYFKFSRKVKIAQYKIKLDFILGELILASLSVYDINWLVLL